MLARPTASAGMSSIEKIPTFIQMAEGNVELVSVSIGGAAVDSSTQRRDDLLAMTLALEALEAFDAAIESDDGDLLEGIDPDETTIDSFSARLWVDGRTAIAALKERLK